MKALERQALLADRRTVQDLLGRLPDSDPLGRMSLQARLDEIDASLAAIEASQEHVGSVALIFGGAPVLGSRSIEVDFATRAIHGFQDMVSKRVASEELGKLGARGPVPVRTTVNLAITDVVRGSVGFALEEVAPNHEIADTVVKKAIDEVADMVAATASERHQDFETVLESPDDRLLVAMRDFFRILDEKRATVRIVESDRETSLDVPAVHRGRQRIDAIQITDSQSEDIVGELLGLLPGSRRFELRLPTGEVIKGSVSAEVGPLYLSLIETPDESPVGRLWRTKMRIREVQERNKPPRKLFTLVGLVERI